MESAAQERTRLRQLSKELEGNIRAQGRIARALGSKTTELEQSIGTFSSEVQVLQGRLVTRSQVRGGERGREGERREMMRRCMCFIHLSPHLSCPAALPSSCPAQELSDASEEVGVAELAAASALSISDGINQELEQERKTGLVRVGEVEMLTAQLETQRAEVRRGRRLGRRAEEEHCALQPPSAPVVMLCSTELSHLQPLFNRWPAPLRTLPPQAARMGEVELQLSSQIEAVKGKEVEVQGLQVALEQAQEGQYALRDELARCGGRVGSLVVGCVL